MTVPVRGSRCQSGSVHESDEEGGLLGRIAVRLGMLTLDQLAEVTRERGRVDKKLGVIMLEKGLLTQVQLAKCLALQKRHLEALEQKARVVAAPQAPRQRIPTPTDWAVDPAARGERQPAPLPRRERRTADVMRQHLEERPAPAGTPRRAQQITQPERPGRAPLPDEGEPEAPVEFELDLDEGPSAPPGPPIPPAPAAPRREEAPVRRDRATPRDRPEPVRVPEQRLPEPPQREPVRPPEPPRAPEPPPSRPSQHAPRPEAEAPAPDSTRPPPRLATEEGELGLEPMPWDAPAPTRGVGFLHKILEHGVMSGASDVHVHAGALAKMRQFGQLVPITSEPLAPRTLAAVLSEIFTPWQRRRFEEDGEIDFAYAIEGLGRFRTNVYRQQNGHNGVFHVIPAQPPTLEQLNVPPALAKLTNYTQGLILLTGPAGSGKTSTLAALVQLINGERHDHILTIEDPIEYVFASQRCVVNQRQVGRHTDSFAAGLRGALREDPDIICIGELRDLETISLALSAAETGHLVLATMHTGNAVATVNRIIGAFPPSQQSQVRAMMSESLRAITSQRLLPLADGSGVVPALEILYVTRPVAALIRDNRAFQIPSVMQTGRAQGMQLLDDALRDLLAQRRISRDVAIMNCEDRRKLEAP
jgi:twitching motility protein PilT